MDFSTAILSHHDEDIGAVSPRKVTDHSVRNIALIGNHLPRRCGIATYTTDVAIAMRSRFPDIQVQVWAVDDGAGCEYADDVTGIILENEIESYRHAAREITASKPDMVWLQHEFGIFGGSAGDYILTLIDRITVPVAVALHTVLSEPDPDQRRVTLALVARCETIIVMADEAKRLLIDIYGAKADQVIIIPHGIPHRAFEPTDDHKQKLGYAGKQLILTFGLLSPGKGIETMIRAMPDVVARHPNTHYLVLGATHPHQVASSGEAYRDQLMALVDTLGMKSQISFIDAFFDTDEILDYLAAADIYVTPYLNPAQVTSGTLAYAVGLGKPIVSTPYVHAKELLDDGNGVLVDFGDSAGFAKSIIGLLDLPADLVALRRRVYALGRTMIWPRLAEASLSRFNLIANQRPNRVIPILSKTTPDVLPLAAIQRLTDDTGMLQHSIFGVPDRAHGYCIDDNARALMLFNRPGCSDAPELTHRYAAFIQSAWNADAGRFRNFMAFNRSWLEDAGSDDSCGRTIWALGETAAHAADPAIAQWAKIMFDTAFGHFEDISSPRAQAFILLGLLALKSRSQIEESACHKTANYLLALRKIHQRPGWNWFEPVLAYDNGRLCEALIRYGHQFDDNDARDVGLSTLAWLNAMQTTDGHFRAIGSDSFGRNYAAPLPFDQQPLEAWAMIDACDAAFQATGMRYWSQEALNAYAWFMGKNDGGLALGDVETGECFDGLTPTGVNENRGAESVLAFHHATISVQRHRRAAC